MIHFCTMSTVVCVSQCQVLIFVYFYSCTLSSTYTCLCFCQKCGTNFYTFMVTRIVFLFKRYYFLFKHTSFFLSNQPSWRLNLLVSIIPIINILICYENGWVFNSCWILDSKAGGKECTFKERHSEKNNLRTESSLLLTTQKRPLTPSVMWYIDGISCLQFCLGQAFI